MLRNSKDTVEAPNRVPRVKSTCRTPRRNEPTNEEKNFRRGYRRRNGCSILTHGEGTRKEEDVWRNYETEI